MRCAFNLETSILLVALLASNIALVSAVNCAPTDDDGSPLTESAVAGTFVTCTYQGAGPCTYFPVDGSFSSGASTCPPGLPQGNAGAPDPSTTPTAAPTPTPTPTPTLTPTSTPTPTPEVKTTTTSTSTSQTPVATTSSTTVTQPPPVPTQTPGTTPPSTTTSAASTPQASSLGVFTSSSPAIITATTVIIVSALVGLPNFLGIAYACASV